MAKRKTLTQARLKAILTAKLSLRHPQFLLERYDSRLVGKIISPTFRGKGDYKRQCLIWDALEEELGRDVARLAGSLLAYTPEEWKPTPIPAPPPRTLSKKRLKTILTAKLPLKDPQFLLERIDGRVLGDIISPTFKGKRDHVRQRLIRDALEEELGPDFARLTGMILAYTPDEWNIDALTMPRPKRRTVG